MNWRERGKSLQRARRFHSLGVCCSVSEEPEGQESSRVTLSATKIGRGPSPTRTVVGVHSCPRVIPKKKLVRHSTTTVWAMVIDETIRSERSRRLRMSLEGRYSLRRDLETRSIQKTEEVCPKDLCRGEGQRKRK